MPNWTEVGSLADLRRKRKLLVTVADDDIVLFYHAGQVYALADLCVHKQRRLSRGLIFQDKAICPGHQWAFDLETGWTDEWAMCQPTYAVHLDDDTIFIDLTPRVLTEPPKID